MRGLDEVEEEEEEEDVSEDVEEEEEEEEEEESSGRNWKIVLRAVPVAHAPKL